MNKNYLIYISICIIIIFGIAIIGLQKNINKSYTKDGFYFDTYNYITVYKESDYEKLDNVFAKMAYYDELFNRFSKASDLYKINESEGIPIQISEETYILLQTAYEFCEESDGAADITVAPLMDLWGFDNDNRTELPSKEELDEVLSHVNYKNLEFLGNNTVQLKDNHTKIDLGFIAKGYVADKIKESMIESGIEKAIISLGGNIQVIGQKDENKPFIIGIKDPSNPENIIREEEIIDESLVTSGTYERYLEIDNEKYHHILDVNTGYPVQNEINGVTVKAKSSTDADALSTICLILGEEKSKPILEKHNATAIFY